MATYKNDWDYWMNEQPPTADEMGEVVNEMALTWQLGGTYFARNARSYFLYVVTILEKNGASRFGGVRYVETDQGKRAALDKYRGPGGQLIEVGYLLK